LSAPVSTHVLIEALSIASVSAVSYVSTNLDNLVILSAYGAKPGYRPFFVKLTFVSVCLVVLLVSLALARAADTLPAVDLRYLGLIPLTLGAYQLVRLTMAGGEDKSHGTAEILGPIGFATAFSRPEVTSHPWLPGTAKMTRRNLVAVRAGDKSLHPHWLMGDGGRNWDLVVSYFGDDPGLYIGGRRGSDRCQGPKMGRSSCPF
jgi:hypothetical protein